MGVSAALGGGLISEDKSNASAKKNAGRFGFIGRPSGRSAEAERIKDFHFLPLRLERSCSKIVFVIVARVRVRISSTITLI